MEAGAGVIAVKTLEILPDHTSSKGHSALVKNYSGEVNLESASVMRAKTEWYKTGKGCSVLLFVWAF